MKEEGENQEKSEEEVAEDWCFECYDGGDLLVCDHENCVKSYHAKCVGKDMSLVEAEDTWFCRRHSCFECKKSSRYQCFGCPNSVCACCLNNVLFVVIRGNKGICNNCLKLALLGEEGLNVDSDGERVDFKDLDTFEGLFLDYWAIIRDKEGLTLEDLKRADILIKRGANYMTSSKSKNSDNEEDFQLVSNSDDDNDSDNANYSDGPDGIKGSKLVHKRKRSNGPKVGMSRHLKPRSEIPKSKRDIVSWASNCLINFLVSIGRDASTRYEQHHVAGFIIEYAQDNKLIDPERKRKIKCDEMLKCLFGKKEVDKNKIVDLLEPHFPENLETSEEEEEEIEEKAKCGTKRKEKRSFISCKKNRKLLPHDRAKEKEVVVRARESYFAAIVSENIKLVYLKKSLVQELCNQSEDFENKVIGSFVRVKLDSGVGSRRYHFELLQVTGIRKMSKEENPSEVLLQVSNLTKDFSVSLLSDDNFSEEECEDLKKKVKSGIIKRPTILEVEQKAIVLHEDIVKHWIGKELVILQHRIDRANEKGRRREFFECLELQRRLRTPEEQQRMVRKIPNVIPDMVDDEMPKDAIEENEKGEEYMLEESILESSELSGLNGAENGNSSEEKEEANQNHTTDNHTTDDDHLQAVKTADKKHQQTVSQDLSKNSAIPDDDVPEYQRNEIPQSVEEKKDCGFESISVQSNNYSAESCLLDVLPQQSCHITPQVDDKLLLSELFQ